MTQVLKKYRNQFILAILVLLVIAVFWQMSNYEFLVYDDNLYVTDNRYVQSGFSKESIVWAFTTNHPHFWMPLTWLTLMLDFELFGLNAGGYHITNLLFHIFNTLLLFFVLQKMTGAFWRSLFVAALFALHPLHVESVAWVTERKDVLSTFFWMLVMYSYVMYVERPLWSRYGFILLFFILGLLSKPMLVTLPFVLLLLDFWPLGRFDKEEGRKLFNFIPSRLIIEKIPLFILTGISCIITFIVQKSGESVSSLEIFSLKTRVFNAVISYLAYIGKTFWPVKLGVFYPYPVELSIGKGVGAALILMVVSFFIVRWIKRLPFLSVGWLWYLGTLVPVVGLVQVGGQSMADRYTYIPLVGLFIMIAWGVPEVLKERRYQKTVITILSGIIIIPLIMLTWQQTGVWKDSVSLFEHTLKVTDKNYVIHNNYGAFLNRTGGSDEAVLHFKEVLKINSRDEYANINMGVAYAQKGRLNEAIYHFQNALKVNHDNWITHKNMAFALNDLGRLRESAFHFREALRINPSNMDIRNNLEAVLSMIKERQ